MDIKLHEVSLMPNNTFEIGFTYTKKNNMFKVAFTGTSGSGKTTLCKFVSEEFNLKHISGSAGDLLNDVDRYYLRFKYNYNGSKGHYGVIQESAINPLFGKSFQEMLQHRRSQIINLHENFVTDRSPIDNLTYCINQIGFHPRIDDGVIGAFAQDCLRAWYSLTHVIYIRAVQPGGIENNGSRIPNKWYQQSVDAQFNYWLRSYFMKTRMMDNGIELIPPKVLIIDFWDLEERKEKIREFFK